MVPDKLFRRDVFDHRMMRGGGGEILPDGQAVAAMSAQVGKTIQDIASAVDFVDGYSDKGQQFSGEVDIGRIRTGTHGDDRRMLKQQQRVADPVLQPCGRFGR